jgi:monofunctional biosynthetic peptidoglycan transglycosylase
MLNLSKLNPIRHILRWIVVIFFGSTILAVVAYRFIPVYFTPLMFIRCFQQIGNGDDLKLKHHWVPMEDISPSLPVAVMASEDQRFLLHHGFDFESIEKAAIHNQKGRKRMHGASTISQQTAKNVFLWPGRSWVRKGFEAYFTVLIEFMWSKQRIMECYLNSIEMGDGIYGADAVAEEHFNTNASNLSRSQCALIAATLPNPRKFNSARPSGYMLSRQGKIMHEMKFIPEFPREGEDVNPKTTVGGVYHKKRH